MTPEHTAPDTPDLTPEDLAPEDLTPAGLLPEDVLPEDLGDDSDAGGRRRPDAGGLLPVCGAG